MIFRSAGLHVTTVLFLGLPTLVASQARMCVMQGNVSNEGRPTSRAQVTVHRLEIQQGKADLAGTECVTSTNENGYFECTSLQPGSYVVAVSFVENGIVGSSPRRDRQDNLPLFAVYPSDIDLRPANLLHIRPGERVWVNIPLEQIPMFPVSIRSAAPRVDSQLTIFWSSGGMKVPLMTIPRVEHKTGSIFKLKNVPRGSYSLTETWFKNGVGHEAVSAEISVPSIDEVAISDLATSDLSGVVRFTGIGSLHLPTLVLSSTGNDAAHLRFSALISDDGSFVFRNVVHGTYRFSFQIQDRLQIEGVQNGSQDSRSDTVEIMDDSGSLPITLTAKRVESSLAGSLNLNGSESYPGLLITSKDSGVSTMLSVDHSEAFAIEGLPKGEYLLTCWRDRTRVPYEDSAYMKSHMENGDSVEIEDGSRLSGIRLDCNDSEF